MVQPIIQHNLNVSFSGCGFLGIYHIGVASCLKSYAPHLLDNKLCGSSAGAIAACCLLCDLPLELITSHTIDIIKEARSKTLGPFSPSMNMSEHLYSRLNEDIPDDVHERVTGKLFVSLTRVPDGKNVIKSEFSTKEEVIQTLLASAFIPVFSGYVPPMIGEYRYIDGGFSDNLPILDKHTITVSPFSGLSDICPQDNSDLKYLVNIANNSFELTKSNCFRLARIMFPPEPEMVSQLCNQGFDDALRFLQKNNLINCKVCVVQRFSFEFRKNNSNESTKDDSCCYDCKWNNAYAKVQGMPYSITYVLDRYIESHNNIFSWIFKMKGMRIISLLSLPYFIAADVAYAFVQKVISSSQNLQNCIWTLSKYIINSLLHFVDVFSQKGLEFVGKVLSYSYVSIENHAKQTPYYYFYNERLEDLKCIRCSKNILEYFNDFHQATSAIVIDGPGCISSELDLYNQQVKSVRSRKHSTRHWTLSLSPDLVLTTSNESVSDKTVTTASIGSAEELCQLKYDLQKGEGALEKFIADVGNQEPLVVYHYGQDLKNKFNI
ncbi:1-acylglycerol-3-phosphate O-acyltransferase Pnpla3-like isoform X2 [Daktulosphaira vitifoliae]|uniref:1-acylglycerol-3-phosphate O-acyltransferase Pnpla3-like isoform X2 n=1 Tax=Daktulosphaira vitifoliae TaxID=58002 RepID=UPI0021AAEB4D|nr:1-acylglycerol-3-phosphate O-acyltransferase Pnpla3-like isoform X2 [Daktulosphaira vitifoliae]